MSHNKRAYIKTVEARPTCNLMEPMTSNHGNANASNVSSRSKRVSHPNQQVWHQNDATSIALGPQQALRLKHNELNDCMTMATQRPCKQQHQHLPLAGSCTAALVHSYAFPQALMAALMHTQVTRNLPRTGQQI